MDSQPWSDQLRHKLREQNLPPAYFDRLVEELSDHLLDSQTETTSMDAQHALTRLGSPDQLTAAATREFRRRTFAGRRPWLTFVATPVLVAPLAFVVFALSLAVFLSLAAAIVLLAGRTLTDNPLEDSVLLAITHAYNVLVRFVPFVVAAWFYCRLAKRSGRDRWALAACTILALISGVLVSKVTPANDRFYPSSWMIGLAFQLTVYQFLQVLAPLVIAAWFLFRLRRPMSPARPAAT